MDLFNTEDLKWNRFTGDERFDYPIDYSGALLSLRDDGHIDLLYRWEPNHYCHFHRHLAAITSTVLQGELEVIDYKDGKEVGRKIRRAGDYSHGGPDHVHMEKAGPEGALVIFHLYSPDGALVEQLAPDGSVIRTTHLSDFQSDRW